MASKQKVGFSRRHHWQFVGVLSFLEKWYKWFLWLKVPPFIDEPEWAWLSNGVGVSEIKTPDHFCSCKGKWTGVGVMSCWLGFCGLWTPAIYFSKSHVRNWSYWLRRLVEYVMKLIDFITKDIKTETQIEWWLMLMIWHYKTNV